MLRKITRPSSITSKQSIVNDHTNNHQWLFSLEKTTKPSSFFLNYNPFFKGFFNYKLYNNQMITPISILDQNPFSILANFLVFDTKNTPKKHFCDEQFSTKKGIVLALIDENNKKNKQKNVVFGPQLRIKLKKKSSIYPREFGIKTRVRPREDLAKNGAIYRNVGVSMSEIDEKSEDYTCVISHGPNPKTTHIFGNCIVEKCCGKNVGVNNFLPNNSKKVTIDGNFTSFGKLSPSQDRSGFLSICYFCNKKLGQGKDIYMYRGERAFCSEECRREEMFFDGAEN